MSIANELVAQFGRMVRSEGGSLIVLDESDSTVRIGYVSGEDPNCESGACVLPPAELQTMMSEWLARRAPGTTVVVQPAATPAA